MSLLLQYIEDRGRQQIAEEVLQHIEQELQATPFETYNIGRLLSPLISVDDWNIEQHIETALSMLGHFADPKNRVALPNGLQEKSTLLLHQWYNLFKDIRSAIFKHPGTCASIIQYKLRHWQKLSDAEFEAIVRAYISPTQYLSTLNKQQ